MPAFPESRRLLRADNNFTQWSMASEPEVRNRIFCEILNMLKSGRMSAGDICAHFDVTGASISRHLSVLREADLIRDTREGKFIFYELNTSVLEDVMLWIAVLKGDSENDKK